MLRYLPLILKDCRRNRHRAILTVVSSGVSMRRLGVTITMYDVFYLSDPTPEQALPLIVRNRIALA